MRIIQSIATMTAVARSLHRRGRTIGFVPTMGALHRGHLSLIERSKKENSRTVVSIFVNPLQFGPSEDFQRYPRPTIKDNRFCREAGVDFLFRPQVRDMYPDAFCTRVEVQGLSDRLCGRFRPGHFQGVATVVLKLFEAVQPDRAYFGEKDFQQLVIIRRMARDLNLPIEIVGCPTIREHDGLALSSRNAYLGSPERFWAPKLHEALAMGAERGQRQRSLQKIPHASVSKILHAMRNAIGKIPRVRIDYVEIVDHETLLPARNLKGRLRIAAAIWIGRTRLIDNVPFYL